MRSLVYTTILIVSTCSFQVQSQTLAFPGAEGFGRFTSGGRGGTVLYVTNLNDSGPGSLRAAVEAHGPRMVLFKISGTIELQSPLRIKEPNITIAGQTAPGDGICIRNNTLDIATDNVIIRFIRCRLGDEAKVQDDAIHALQGKNIIIDHCSFSWSVDEVASFYDKVENLTVQWCIISESLNKSVHRKGEHGYGGIWGGRYTTFHHNLLAHHTSRTPRFNNGNIHRPDEHVDCVNNVIYNWGYNSAYGGELGYHNIRFNYYKPGPATRVPVRNRIVEPWDSTGFWYVEGNFIEGDSVVSADNWSGGVQGKFAHYFRERRPSHPFETAPVTVHTPHEAFQLVLQYAGACFPKRDPIDARIIEETRTGTARFGTQWDGGRNGIIDSQKDVGGWPVLHSDPAPIDTDSDGIPDAWEQAHGLNPNDPHDGSALTPDGYTLLEVYLHSLVEAVIVQ
ncbi:MAG: pectate lyase [Bacteroidetes bacterium]|nr:pectate lyase [Bacteroidota bacterium]